MEKLTVLELPAGSETPIFFSSRRRHTRWNCDWSSDVCSSDLLVNRYGVRNLKIADEMFVLNRKHVLGICDRLIERSYDLNIWAYTRVDTVKEDMIDKLKAAGFRSEERRVGKECRTGWWRDHEK